MCGTSIFINFYLNIAYSEKRWSSIPFDSDELQSASTVSFTGSKSSEYIRGLQKDLDRLLDEEFGLPSPASRSNGGRQNKDPIPNRECFLFTRQILPTNKVRFINNSSPASLLSSKQSYGIRYQSGGKRRLTPVCEILRKAYVRSKSFRAWEWFSGLQTIIMKFISQGWPTNCLKPFIRWVNSDRRACVVILESTWVISWHLQLHASFCCTQG